MPTVRRGTEPAHPIAQQHPRPRSPVEPRFARLPSFLPVTESSDSHSRTGPRLHLGLRVLPFVKRRSSDVLSNSGPLRAPAELCRFDSLHMQRRFGCEEIGIADNLLTATPADQNVLMHSFY